MKKTILTSVFALATLFASAQLNLLSTGELVHGASTVIGGEFMSVQKAQNGWTALRIYNSDNTSGHVGASASLTATTAAGSISMTAYNGFYVASNMFEPSAGVISANGAGGMNIGTSNLYRLAFWTNNTKRMTLDISGNLGIGLVPSGTYKLEVNGTTQCTGNAWTSDSTKKKNIHPLSINALSVINQLRPVTFEWKKIIDDGMKGTQMGFIAQDLEKVLPSMVLTKSDTIVTVTINDTVNSTVTTKNDTVKRGKSVKYIELLPVIIKAMQQQQKMIDSLFTIVNVAKGLRTNGSGNDSQGNINIHDLELASGNAIIYQNAPNPFGDGTTIKYFIPDNVQSAQIIFFDSFGNQIKEFKVEEKGMGQLNVSTLNLAVGVYSYSLLVNGKAIDTKKMLKSN